MIAFIPVIAPLATAAILLALWTRPQARRYVALIGSLAHVVAGLVLFNTVQQYGVVSAKMGNWDPPFGIFFQIDRLGAILIAVAAIIGFLINLYSAENLEPRQRDFGFHPLFFVLLAGVSGAFATNDLFNLFVWFECILLSSFVLLSLGGEKDQIRGALNYVVPNLFSSIMFLSGLGLLYGVTGTLNMNDLTLRVQDVPVELATPISLMFLVAFGIKAAVFPFFSWLPTSYHTPPTAITALFAGLLTKVGVYALIRFFTKVNPLTPGILSEVLIWASVLTMLVAIVAACVATDLKKVLAYNIVSHIGTLIAGLAMKSQLGMEGTIFYMVHHIITITALFLVVGITERQYGTTNMKKMGDGLKVCPWVAVAFFVLSLALAGIPPLSGFWPKLVLVQAGLLAVEPALVVAILIVGLLTLYSMMRAWALVFWRPFPDNAGTCPSPITDRPSLKYGPAFLLTLFIVIIGLMPNALANYSQDASQEIFLEQLTDVPETTVTQGGDL